MVKVLHYPVYILHNGDKKDYFIRLGNPCYETAEQALEHVVGDGFELMAMSNGVSACSNRTVEFPVLDEGEEGGVRLVEGMINGFPVHFCAGPIWESGI